MQPVDDDRVPIAHIAVSILTRPGGRVQPPPHEPGDGVRHRVSILTRPGGRVQLPPFIDKLVDAGKFQILTRPGGRVQRLSMVGPIGSGFQSSPAPEGECNGSRWSRRKPDASHDNLGTVRPRDFGHSILTPTEDRRITDKPPIMSLHIPATACVSTRIGTCSLRNSFGYLHISGAGLLATWKSLQVRTHLARAREDL